MSVAKLFILISIFMLKAVPVYAGGYDYEKRHIDGNVVHVVTIYPNVYKAAIVKSNDGEPGRETTNSIAKRSGAEIAINGGFFQIGGDEDGAPSGTLVIDGHKYGVKDRMQALIVINAGKISVLQGNPREHISSDVSMVSGIPLLINDGKIVKSLAEENSDFYVKPHARTALGLRHDGAIIIVVAEHSYLIDWTMILGAELTSADESRGLTMLELAKLMEELKCQTAVNLDGGGSSTLWIKDKVVNKAIGDVDESDGMQEVRPVSDAIIFKK